MADDPRLTSRLADRWTQNQLLVLDARRSVTGVRPKRRTAYAR